MFCRQREGSHSSEEPEYWDKFAKLATDPDYEERQAQGPLVVRPFATLASLTVTIGSLLHERFQTLLPR